MIFVPVDFIIHRFPTLGSTNDYLKSLPDAPAFTVIVAEEQTAGRGRRDRAWHSSPGDGLYVSILLRPERQLKYLSLISLLAAIAVDEAMREHGIDGVDIKWPNDVLLNGRKVCGILAEGMNAGASHRIILGIGVNLNHSQFPAALAETATSIARETGTRVSAADFLSRLLARIGYWYERWREGNYAQIIERWESLSSFARGARVAVTTDEEQITGTTDGLTDAGALRLVTDRGETKIILTGEVARLRKIPDVFMDTHLSGE